MTVERVSPHKTNLDPHMLRKYVCPACGAFTYTLHVIDENEWSEIIANFERHHPCDVSPVMPVYEYDENCPCDACRKVRSEAITAPVKL